MKSIIPEHSQSTIFDKLIQAAMDDFIAEGEVKTINCHQKCWPLFFLRFKVPLFVLICDTRLFCKMVYVYLYLTWPFIFEGHF